MEFKDVSEARASVYWFFSALFSKELELEQIQSLASGEASHFLDQLAKEPDLSSTVVILKKQLNKLVVHPTGELELKSQFADLFLMDFKQSAPPYASVYLSNDHLLMQEPHHAMLKQLESMGVKVVDNFKEPADHISIELDCLGNIVLQGVQAETEAERDKATDTQVKFIKQHLTSWLPLFKRKVDSREVSFYTTLTQLLCHYIEQDIAYLKAKKTQKNEIK
jgi:TorA-specific chaperone